MSNQEMLPIKVVSQRTGLTQHVIRVWEKRYGAVSPSRNTTNRRFYTDKEVTRLSLLREAIENGFSIGQIAHLPSDQISSMIAEKPLDLGISANNQSIDQYIEGCLAAIAEIDTQKLDEILTKAQVELNPSILIDDLIVPLLYRIGNLWQEGRLRIVEEHLASAVIRNLLGRIKTDLQPTSVAPKIIIATPPRQWHELGALLAAATAAYEGWKVIYLGANLPVEEITKAAQLHKAKLVALSIIYPVDDPYLHLDLKKLRNLLGSQVQLIIGGQATEAYLATIQSINATVVTNLKSFRQILNSLRSPNKHKI